MDNYMKLIKKEGCYGMTATSTAFSCQTGLYYNTAVIFWMNSGSGFTGEERVKFWLTRDNLIGKLIKLKYTDYGA
jgi:hypothetical protein